MPPSSSSASWPSSRGRHGFPRAGAPPLLPAAADRPAQPLRSRTQICRCRDSPWRVTRGPRCSRPARSPTSTSVIPWEPPSPSVLEPPCRPATILPLPESPHLRIQSLSSPDHVVIRRRCMSRRLSALLPLPVWSIHRPTCHAALSGRSCRPLP